MCPGAHRSFFHSRYYFKLWNIAYSDHDAKPRARQCDGVLSDASLGPYNKQKQIYISNPKLDNFVHKIYIHVARKCYSNVYLFENRISPLQMQKNNREFERRVFC